MPECRIVLGKINKIQVKYALLSVYPPVNQ